MKKLVGLLVLGVAVWFGYKVFIARESPPGGERVAALEQRLDSAVQRFHQASRGAALSGVDTTGDAEVARIEIESVAREVATLERSAASEDEKAGVQRLRGKIREARGAIGER